MATFQPFGLNTVNNIWTAMGGHVGSWNTPELNISENIARAVGAPINQQGGSALRTQISRNIASAPSVSSQTYDSPYPTKLNVSTGGTTAKTLTTSSGTPTTDTGDGSSGGSPGGTVDAALASWQNTVNSGYDKIYGRLDELAGWMPGWQAEDTKRVEDASASMATDLTGGRDAANAKLALSKSNVQEQGKRSTADLAQQLRNSLKTSNLQLGSVGGGDTSAGQIMAPYAFNKIASQQRGNVLRQVNDQLAAIDQKGIDVQTTYDTANSQLGQWKTGKLQEISDKYKGYLIDIQNQRIGADQSKLQALSQIESTIMQNAQNEVDRLEADEQSYRASLDSWIKDRVTALSDYKTKLSDSGTYNVQDVIYNNLSDYIGGLNTVGLSSDWLNPYSLTAKKKTDTTTL